MRITFYALIFFLLFPMLHVLGTEAEMSCRDLRGTPVVGEWLLSDALNRINKDYTDAQIEEQVAYGTVNFIIPGIHNNIPEAFVRFKRKYGIGLHIENCAIDPFAFKSASENNIRIAKYLNNIYGQGWQDELPVKPLGIR